MSTKEWTDPTGLPYLGGVIGEWAPWGESKSEERRDVVGGPLDREMVAWAVQHGADHCTWHVWAGAGEVASGEAPALAAAKRAADRALLREVFVAWGWDGTRGPYGYVGPADVGVERHEWTTAQVLEILEGVAGAPKIEVHVGCVDEASPALSRVVDKLKAMSPAPLTDEQLAEIVTGLWLGGWVIGARTLAGVRAGCPGSPCSGPTNTRFYVRCRPGGARVVSFTAPDADRQLLTWSLEEARDEGRLAVHHDVCIYNPGGPLAGNSTRSLADIRAALPGFDWSGVPGYGAKAPRSESECMECDGRGFPPSVRICQSGDECTACEGTGLEPEVPSRRPEPPAPAAQGLHVGQSVLTDTGRGEVRELSGPLARVALGRVTCWFPRSEVTGLTEGG